MVDDIRVIAIESGQDIRAHSAIEHVCGYIARDPIGEIVPGAIDRIGPGQDEELNVGTEREAVHVRINAVEAFTDILCIAVEQNALETPAEASTVTVQDEESSPPPQT